MPLNKNAVIRYQALDRCFSDFHHRYYIDDLIDACAKALIEYTGYDSVSRRTIFEDINFMESSQGWSIPLERHKDGKRVYYRYEERGFSINKQELSADELAQLKTTILTISRYRGLPSHEWLEDVISNLEYRFHLKPQNENILSFEQNQRLKGIEYLSTLIDAAANKQTLNITYRSYEEKETTWTIYPYYLKQYNSRWFLFGLNAKLNSISNLPLDRIKNIKTTDLPFIDNKEIDFDTYFDDIVGVTKPKPEVRLETIRMKFDKMRFPYVVSKPIHQTQVVVDEEKCILEIRVRPNKELEALILSFGPQVEILSPTHFREQIFKKIMENLKIYIPVQLGCTDGAYFCNVNQKDDKNRNVKPQNL